MSTYDSVIPNSPCRDREGRTLFGWPSERHYAICVTCQTENVTTKACATCGEREGSTYAKLCCTDENMIEE